MHFADMLRHPSLRMRLLTSFGASLLLSAAIVTAVVILLLHPFNKYVLQSGILDYAQGIARSLVFDRAGNPVGVGEDRIDDWVFTGLGKEVELRILDAQGNVIQPVSSGEQPLAPDGSPFNADLEVFQMEQDGVAMHAATIAVRHQGRTWYVQFAVSDRFVLKIRRTVGLAELMQGLAATCVLFLAISLLSMHFTLRVALRPLRQASATARGITPRSLATRLDANSQPAEIRPLVEAVNHALEHLAHGFRTQQEFLSNTAHELKTPLALIRAQVELGPRDERQKSVLQDVDLMARHVQQLLMLAEVSEPQNFRITLCDPRPAFQEAFEFMARVAEHHDVALTIRLDDTMGTWMVDRSALFTLLKNLLENAIQHSPQGGIVMMEARANGFSIKDQGPGVPEADLPFIFDRFWREKTQRQSGTGLGLAICREIALAHGWSLSAVSSGAGLEVIAIPYGTARGPDEGCI